MINQIIIFKLKKCTLIFRKYNTIWTFQFQLLIKYLTKFVVTYLIYLPTDDLKLFSGISIPIDITNWGTEEFYHIYTRALKTIIFFII